MNIIIDNQIKGTLSFKDLCLVFNVSYEDDTDTKKLKSRLHFFARQVYCYIHLLYWSIQSSFHLKGVSLCTSTYWWATSSFKVSHVLLRSWMPLKNKAHFIKGIDLVHATMVTYFCWQLNKPLTTDLWTGFKQSRHHSSQSSVAWWMLAVLAIETLLPATQYCVILITLFVCTTTINDLLLKKKKLQA